MNHPKQHDSPSTALSARTAHPIALTIAGSDSGGGAGIQADLKTFSALGVYGASVITALTAQNTREVRAIHDVPAEFVTAQLHTVLDDLDVRAIKVGMLSSVAIIEAVAAFLREQRGIPVVIDPVMVAKSGDKLLQDSALRALIDTLCPLATVLTPNCPEAALLSDDTEATDEQDMVRQAEALRALGGDAVLLKGGHLAGDSSTDILVDGHGELQRFAGRRIDTRNTHGTGCTLSAAIAAHLAHGLDVAAAVTAAKHYLQDAIEAADQLAIGDGHGPVHHFHAWWSAG